MQLGGPAAFADTRWTLVDALRDGAEGDRRRASAELARIYWKPVHCAVRRAGFREHEADDLTQSFFAEVVLGRTLFERADPERGRLRALIRASLQRFLVDERRRRGRRPEMPLNGNGNCDAARAGSGMDAPAAFDREWAVAALVEAMSRCERHFTGAGRGRHWQLFEARVLVPAIRGSQAPPLAGLATDLGFKSAADAAAAVQVVKTRALALLRMVVAEVVPESEAEDEFRAMLALLGI